MLSHRADHGKQTREPAAASADAGWDLFLSVIVVLAAVAVEQLTLQGASLGESLRAGKLRQAAENFQREGYPLVGWLHWAALALFFFSVFACLAIIVRHWRISRRQTGNLVRMALFDSLGSFLLAAAATCLALLQTPQVPWFPEMILSTVALLTFGWAFYQALTTQALWGAARHTSPSAVAHTHSIASDQVSLPARPQPLFVETPKHRQPLPPLFSDDPLYLFPSPRKARLFVQAKGNGSLLDCEDSCAMALDEQCFALCDGTSTSGLPRPWATLLARQWVDSPVTGKITAPEFISWLEHPRLFWEQWVRETWLPTLNARNQQLGQPPLPERRADEVIQRGASSTLLGIRLSLSPQAAAINWQATAIGDSCLFIFHRNQGQWHLEYSFPLTHPSEFNDRPAAISTSASGAALLPSLRQDSGICQRGDLLVMATDALAKWLMQAEAHTARVWTTLLTTREAARFQALIEAERAVDRLDDDDSTLIIIQPEVYLSERLSRRSETDPRRELKVSRRMKEE